MLLADVPPQRRRADAQARRSPQSRTPGALRAAWGAKGWSFYAHNPVFHVKITLFVLVGLLSIVPTLAFLRWRRAQRADPAARVADAAWRRVRGFVIAELVLVALIPLAAVVMARGLR